MRNLRRKFAFGLLMALCVNFVAMQVVFAGQFSIDDEAGMNAILDRTVENVDQNPESIRQRNQFDQEQFEQRVQDEGSVVTPNNFDSERGTILPNTTAEYSSVDSCKKLINELSTTTSEVRKSYFQENGATIHTSGGMSFTQSDILGCGIKTGSISLWMVPYYVRYVLEFAIQMAGLVCVGGIVYGGYLYLFAGVSDEKDKGKKAIMYSLAGMIITMIAWAVVNIVIGFLTG